MKDINISKRQKDRYANRNKRSMINDQVRKTIDQLVSFLAVMMRFLKVTGYEEAQLVVN
jgi:hypothetical protein